MTDEDVKRLGVAAMIAYHVTTEAAYARTAMAPKYPTAAMISAQVGWSAMAYAYRQQTLDLHRRENPKATQYFG